jgi:hypothetical protein
MTRTLTNNTPKTSKTSTSTPRRLSVMTRQHPRWEEFVVRLEGPEGLSFTLGPKRGQMRSRCSGHTDRPYARSILTAMGGMNVEGSMKYFEDHGGFCDCEILLNVDRLDEGSDEA